MIDFDNNIKNTDNFNSRIKVLGIGGAGCNMVNSMVKEGYTGVDFAILNTDSQVLDKSNMIHKIQLGVKSAKGLGAGANPEIGKKAAEEDLDKILEFTSGADIVFLAAGLGGGTGSGALPVIAKALKEKFILSVGIVTKPFTFEGRRRIQIADNALNLIEKEIDTLIVLPNQKLIDNVDAKVSLMDAFSMINDVLCKFVTSLSDIITKSGYINVDFADIKAIMKNQGYAIIGSSRASGEDRAIQAALQAISSPLLDNINIKGARGVLLNISGNSNLGLSEMSQAASIIYEKADEQANIVLGSVIDENLKDEICVTIIATGFSNKELSQQNFKQIDDIESNIKVNNNSKADLDDNITDNNVVYNTSNDMRSKEDNRSFKVEEKGSSYFDNSNLDVPAILRRKANQSREF